MSGPYLSIVITSRNDDHGGDPVRRTQAFLDSLAGQCRKYDFDVELIIIEWNPPSNRPPLREILDWRSAQESGRLVVKIITVPNNLHQYYSAHERLSLFQMAAKNVGIRRAAGEFVLCTNIDIFFSDELFSALAKKVLDRRKMYRVERHDVANCVLEFPIERRLEACRSNIVRRNRRYAPAALLQTLDREPNILSLTKKTGSCFGFAVIDVASNAALVADQDAPPRELMTNACGDFTLMHRTAWGDIRGYAEFDSYSFNIDSLACYSAHYSGILETSLVPPAVCYHIEHSTGSGWSPEGEEILFERLRKNSVTWPDWLVFWPVVEKMRTRKDKVIFNREDWGLAFYSLPVETLTVGGSFWQKDDFPPVLDGSPPLAQPIPSIKYEWNLDRFQSAHYKELLSYHSSRFKYLKAVISRVPLFQTVVDWLHRRVNWS